MSSKVLKTEEDFEQLAIETRSIKEVLFLKDKEIYNLGRINEQIANSLKSKNEVRAIMFLLYNFLIVTDFETFK